MKFLRMTVHDDRTTWGCEYDQDHMVEYSQYFAGDRISELVLYIKEEEGGLGSRIWSKRLDYDPGLGEVAGLLKKAMEDLYGS